MESTQVIIYPVWNDTNILLTKQDVKKILKKGGIKREIENLEIFQEAFIHESYCSKTDFVKYEKYYGKYEPIDLTKEENKKILPLQEKTGERLEWLGDGILQSVMANYLYKRYEDQQEGFLTKLRSKLVKTDTLSKLAKYLGLDKYLIMSKQKEIIQNGRIDDRILEDSFEALIGAMSIEFGKDDEIDGIRVCRDFIIKVYEDTVDFAALIMVEDNYKDQLMRYYHQKFEGTFPVYEVKNVEIVDTDSGIQKRKYHIIVKNPDGTVVGEAVSFMKKDAETKAAKAALNYYGIMDGF